jgi:hypothetical protein
MTTTDYEIALATSVDIAGILELQDQNLSSRGGTLSVALSREWFERTLTEMPVIVARSEGRVGEPPDDRTGNRGRPERPERRRIACLAISRDSHYQMSNRFAWSWKLAEYGIPVVLVYLGFLNASEMVDRGDPFANQDSWESLVMAHSSPLFPGRSGTGAGP